MASTGKFKTDAKNTKECKVEAYLKARVEDAGGIIIKLNPLWYTGILDRLVFLPGRVAVVELKRPKGGRLQPAQKMWIKRLTALGVECHVICTSEQVNSFMGDD